MPVLFNDKTESRLEGVLSPQKTRKPLIFDNDTENKLEDVLSQYSPSQSNAVVPSRVPEPNPRSQLSFMDRFLTNPVVSPVIDKVGDVLTGGVPLPEAERYGQEQWENIKQIVQPNFIPKVLSSLSPITPVEEQEKMARTLSTITDRAFAFPKALQKVVFPTEGQGRLESAYKALVRPDLVPQGYLGGEISKMFPADESMARKTPRSPGEALRMTTKGAEVPITSPRVLIPGLLGTAGELQSYKVGMGSGQSKFERGIKQAKIKNVETKIKSTAEEVLPEAIKKFKKEGRYPKGWNEADIEGVTKVKLQRFLGDKPKLVDELFKKEKTSDIFIDKFKRSIEKLKGREGQKEIPFQKPSKEDIISKIAGVKGVSPVEPIKLDTEKSLIDEAKKYKTADEFVESRHSNTETKTGKPIILKSYHGTNKDFDKFEIQKEGVRYTGDGIYFTPDKVGAESFAGEKGRVVESYLDLMNPYNMYIPEGNIDWQPGSEKIKEITDAGHDSIIVRLRDTDTETGIVEDDWINEIVVFDTSVIKTKSEISDIWNKAQQKGIRESEKEYQDISEGKPAMISLLEDKGGKQKLDSKPASDYTQSEDEIAFNGKKDEAIQSAIKDIEAVTLTKEGIKGDIVKGKENGLRDIRSGNTLRKEGDFKGQKASSVKWYDTGSPESKRTARKQRVSTVVKELKERGFVDHRGREVNSPQDAAELSAVFRHPKIEQYQVIFLKSNKVVAHSVLSSGDVAAVALSFKDLSKIKSQVKRLGADSIYLAHNHPGGNPTPSKEDHIHTDFVGKIMREAGVKFEGSIVTNGDSYVFIKQGVDSSTDIPGKFNKKLKKYNIEDKSITSYVDAAEIAKDFIKKGKATVMFLDNTNRVLSVDYIGLNKKVIQYIKDKKKNYGANKYIIVKTNNSYISQDGMPSGLLDIIGVQSDGSGASSLAEQGKLKEIKERYGDIYRVQEEDVGYGKGYKEGLIVERKESRKGRSAIISKFRLMLQETKEVSRRKAELIKLKQDILSRDKSTADIAKLKSKYTEKIAKMKRDFELDILEKDIKSRIKTRDVLKIKKDISQYVINNLPKEVRGKYLTAIENANTPGALSKAFRRVDKEADMIERKTLISEIKSKVSASVKSGKIDVKYKQQISDIISGVDLVKRSPETMKKLRRLEGFIKSQVEAGNPVEMPHRILEKLKILYRRPIKDMSIAELKNILVDINVLGEMGRLGLKTRESIYDLQKKNIKNNVIDSALAFDKNPLLEDVSGGKRLSLKEKLKNIGTKLHNNFHELDLVLTPMDTFFDLLDGGYGKFDGANYRNFKSRIDTQYQSYMNTSYKYLSPVSQMIKDLKFNDASLERVGIHAAKQQDGGFQKLIDTGLTPKQINAIELNENELKLYKSMRKALDSIRPDIERIMREVYNKPLANVENYFSFLTDFEKTNQRRMHNRIFVDGDDLIIMSTKKVKKGFTIERTLGNQAIKLNAWSIFSQHMDNASYLVNMSRDAQMLFEIANSPEYSSAAGQLGSEMVIDWLDLISRKGGVAGAHRIAIVDILRRNTGAAILGFNASSILIQPTAIFDGASIIGSHAFDGFYQIITSKEKRKFVVDNMPELRERIGDDPAYNEFGSNKSWEAYQKAGYAGIRAFDSITASGVAYGAYSKKMKELGLKVDLNNPNKESVSYAQEIVRRTQSSALFKDAPMVVSKGKGVFSNRSLNRAFFQFQTFVLGRWSNIRNLIYRANIKGGRTKDKNSKDYKSAVMSTVYLIMAFIAETAMRRKLKEGTKKLLGDETENKYDKGFVRDLVMNMATTIPFTSPAVSMWVYNKQAITSWGSAEDIGAVRGIFTGKSLPTKLRAGTTTLGAVGTLLGASGTGQVKKLARVAIKANSEENIIEMYIKALNSEPDSKTRNKYREKATNLAIQKGLPVNRLSKKAFNKIKAKERKFVSNIEEKLQKKSNEGFNKAINKMIKSGELSKYGASKVDTLRIKRFEMEKEIKKEVAAQQKIFN